MYYPGKYYLKSFHSQNLKSYLCVPEGIPKAQLSNSVIRFIFYLTVTYMLLY